MRAPLFSASVACALLIPRDASAQNPECAGVAVLEGARETCNVAVDLARAYHPVVGLAISGGNPVSDPAPPQDGLAASQ